MSAESGDTLAVLDRIDQALTESPDAMRWNPDEGARAHDNQCDESCHETGLDACLRCDTGRWDLLCDSCRSYVAQDGA